MEEPWLSNKHHTPGQTVDDPAAKESPHSLPRYVIESDAGAYSSPRVSLSRGFFPPMEAGYRDPRWRKFKKINKLPRFLSAAAISLRHRLACKYREISILKKN